MPALTFIADHAGIIAIVAVIVAVLLLAEWRRFRRHQQVIAARGPFFLEEEVRRALHPEAYDHPGRDGDRQRVIHSNHNEGN